MSINMNKFEELKPCPFCGGEAAMGYSKDGNFIHCVECSSATDHLTEHGNSRDDARKAWNSRILNNK